MPESTTFPNFIRRIRAGDDQTARELVERYESVSRRTRRRPCTGYFISRRPYRDTVALSVRDPPPGTNRFSESSETQPPHISPLMRRRCT
jgi:hypothetical protein